MTEPAILALELRSHLFDSSRSRDHWPRLQFAYIGFKAAAASVGPSSGTSDHKCIYRAMPTVQVISAFQNSTLL